MIAQSGSPIKLFTGVSTRRFTRGEFPSPCEMSGTETNGLHFTVEENIYL